MVEGEDAVGGGAGGGVGGGVVAGGVVLGAHEAVEALPFGGGEMALGMLLQGAAEGDPGGAEAGGGGVEGLGAGEEGGMKGIGGAAAGLERAEVESADAAIGGEGGPEGFVGLGRAEGSPFLVEPLADGEFVFGGVFAAAGGVEKPFVGVFDAQLGVGAGLIEEEGRDGVGGAGAGAEEERD